MKVITAPNQFNLENKFSVFLAGSIENGKAEKWQEILIDSLTNEEVLLLNPRRSNWDASWGMDVSNLQLTAQINWELKAQEEVDLIVMYFDKNSKSPITLLELGLFARSGRLVVCCPKGFWRKANVDVVCQRYGVPQVDSLEALIQDIKKHSKK